MEKVELVAETKCYIECPNCKTYKHEVSHLFGKIHMNFGPWYCDNCGVGIKGTIVGATCKQETEVFIEICDEKERVDDALVVLKHDDIILVVEGLDFPSHEDSNNKYYYEEHTCPTNYFNQTRIVVQNKDTDPHGLFELIDFIKVPRDGVKDRETRFDEKEQQFYENLNSGKYDNI